MQPLGVQAAFLSRLRESDKGGIRFRSASGEVVEIGQLNGPHEDRPLPEHAQSSHLVLRHFEAITLAHRRAA